MKYPVADIPAQCRQMGAIAYRNGETKCPFAERSNAARYWQEGFNAARNARVILTQQSLFD